MKAICGWMDPDGQALTATDIASLYRQDREALLEQIDGAFLSGGTDSPTLAGTLTEVRKTPARTYAMGFEAAGFDEMEYARIAARHFGTDVREYYVTPQHVVDTIRKVLLEPLARIPGAVQNTLAQQGQGLPDSGQPNVARPARILQFSAPNAFGRDYGTMLWVMMMLEQWLQSHEHCGLNE